MRQQQVLIVFLLSFCWALRLRIAAGNPFLPREISWASSPGTQQDASPRPFEYVNPAEGATLVSPSTTVSLRPPVCPIDLVSAVDKIIVVSQVSGKAENGSLALGDDRCTLIFVPEEHFNPLDVVDVRVEAGILSGSNNDLLLDSYSWEFTISPYNYESSTIYKSENSNSKSDHDVYAQSDLDIPLQLLWQEVINSSENRYTKSSFEQESIDLSKIYGVGGPYATLPEIQGPLLKNRIVNNLTQQVSSSAPDYIFASCVSFFRPTFYLILDHVGELVYYMSPTNGFMEVTDFNVQENGHLTFRDGVLGGYVEMDQSYRVVKTHTAKHGYFSDFHGFKLNKDGRSLAMIYDKQAINFTDPDIQKKVQNSKLRGSTMVLLPIVQEIDTHGNVLLEFRAWDKFPEMFSCTKVKYFEGMAIWDVAHINSVDWVEDMDLLISFRHMGILKVSRRTGEILWRLGSEEPFNQFLWVGDDRSFTHQHDVRMHEGGKLTMFDNGNSFTPRYSRAVEYRINETDRIIERVWEYRYSPDFFGFATGSAQRMDKGDFVINWGGLGNPPMPFYTEVSRSGEIKAEFEFHVGGSYRTYKRRWRGMPLNPPSLVYMNDVLYFSWNGATEVHHWVVFGHSQEDRLLNHPLAHFNKTSFEQKLSLKSVSTEVELFRVAAFDFQDKQLGISSVVNRS